MFSNELSTHASALTARTAKRGRTRAAYVALCLLLATFVFTSCQTAPKVKLPNVVGANPTPQELYEAVNKNTAKIKSFHTSSARVGQGNLPGTAACSISYKESSYFRLVGSIAMQGRMLDCGSNAEKFWYWNSMVNENNIYTCSLDKFQNSALSEEFPLDPSWFPEALGIIHIDPDDVIDGPYPDPRDSKRLAMKIRRRRPEGVYTEVISFEPLTAEVVRQEICNPQGQKVVVVTCKAHNIDEETGAVVPSNLEIYCPAANLTFILNINSFQINNESALMDFNIPTDLKDARVVDLSNRGSEPLQSANAAAPTSSAVNPPVTSPSANAEPTDASKLNSVPIGDSPVNNQAAPAIGSASAPTNANATTGIVPFPGAGTASPTAATTANAVSQTGMTPPAYTFAQETPTAAPVAPAPMANEGVVAASIYSPAAGYDPNANTNAVAANAVPAAPTAVAPVAEDALVANNIVRAPAASMAPAAEDALLDDYDANDAYVPQTSFANAELDDALDDSFDNDLGEELPTYGQAAYQNGQARQQAPAQQYQPSQHPQQQTQGQVQQQAQPQAQQGQAQGQALPTYGAPQANAQEPIYPGLTAAQAAQPTQVANNAVATQNAQNAAQTRPGLSQLQPPATYVAQNWQAPTAQPNATPNAVQAQNAPTRYPAASANARAAQVNAQIPATYTPAQAPAQNGAQAQPATARPAAQNAPTVPDAFDELELLDESDDFPTLEL